MVEVWLPYGSSEIPARIPEERLIEIIRSRKAAQGQNLHEEVKRLVDSNSKLRDKAAKAERICIALGASSSAHAQAESAKGLIEALVEAGASSTSFAIICTPDAPKPNPADFPNMTLDYHQPISSATSSLDNFKGDFHPAINSVFKESDLKVILGELKPHHFLGYSGVCDIVFPGLGSAASTQAQLSDRAGVEVSDVMKERMHVTNAVESLYAVGYALDSELAAARTSLGEIDECVKELRTTVDDLCSQEIKKPADIAVISAGGVPMDESLLNAVDMFPAGLTVLKRDGVMIVAAECAKGHGNGDFYGWVTERKEPRHLEARLRHNFNYQGFKAAFLLRALEKHRIYLVSTVPDHFVENVFGLRAAETVNAALQTVQRSLGSDSTISVIPDASRVKPKLMQIQT